MVAWTHCFGPVVRKNIEVGVHAKTKRLILCHSEKKEDKWGEREREREREREKKGGRER
jgi:hypothetical protein